MEISSVFRKKKKKSILRICIFRERLVPWLAKMVEDFASVSGSLAPYQSKHEGNRTFLAHRGQNKFDIFLKLNEVGNGAIISHLVIPEGRQGCGWVDYFAKYAVGIYVGQTNSVSVSVSGQRVVHANRSPSGADEVPKPKPSNASNAFHRTINNFQNHSNAPLRSAVLKPLQVASGSHSGAISGSNNFNRVVSVNGKRSMLDLRRVGVKQRRLVLPMTGLLK